ncbi:DUF2059 domain-containing protein [Chitinophaga sp. NPDC101104]|uniref:DUF2059 domain-containing protein n=1 Tax=Chitinophaga sp. NPDC101104 TaxID=3390561 RepID=UPI003CFD4D74
MKKILFTMTFAAFATAASAQATDTAKVRKLVSMMDGEQMGKKMLKLMEVEIRKNAPILDSMFYVEMHQLANFEDLVKQQIPLYCKYYTNEEIEQQIAFYQTPLGKKMLAVLPELTVEAMKLGEQWGQDLIAVLAARYKRRLEQQQKAEGGKHEDASPVPPPPPPPPPARNGK